jgi:hypothetical protein
MIVCGTGQTGPPAMYYISENVLVAIVCAVCLLGRLISNNWTDGRHLILIYPEIYFV